MSDWYVEHVELIGAAAADLHSAIDGVVDSLRLAGRLRTEGAELVDLVRWLGERGGRRHRLGPTLAFREFETALAAYRAQAVRVLVDEDHLTFSEIARLAGVSRQMVAKLYRRDQGIS